MQITQNGLSYLQECELLSVNIFMCDALRTEHAPLRQGRQEIMPVGNNKSTSSHQLTVE